MATIQMKYAQTITRQDAKNFFKAFKSGQDAQGELAKLVVKVAQNNGKTNLSVGEVKTTVETIEGRHVSSPEYIRVSKERNVELYISDRVGLSFWQGTGRLVLGGIGTATGVVSGVTGIAAVDAVFSGAVATVSEIAIGLTSLFVMGYSAVKTVSSWKQVKGRNLQALANALETAIETALG